MIKSKHFFLVLFLILLQIQSLGGIAGSEHDLRGQAAFGNLQEICKVCHVPHQSATSSYLVKSGRIYAGGNLTFYGSTVGQPTNSSSICLSCHDGTLAPSVGTSSTDYTHTHPFSTNYPIKTGYSVPVGGQVVGSYGTLKLEGTPPNRMECGSCHSAHERGVSGKFLSIENTNSNLCLTCHQK